MINRIMYVLYGLRINKLSYLILSYKTKKDLSYKRQHNITHGCARVKRGIEWVEEGGRGVSCGCAHSSELSSVVNKNTSQIVCLEWGEGGGGAVSIQLFIVKGVILNKAL
jgi:hypothetical protein